MGIGKALMKIIYTNLPILHSLHFKRMEGCGILKVIQHRITVRTTVGSIVCQRKCTVNWAHEKSQLR